MKDTVVTFVLDQSGSMASILDDTIGGFNTYLESLRDPKHGKVEFSLVLFDSNAIDRRYVAAPISDVLPLTPETYRPGASTPLIDAAYKAIVATRDATAERDVQRLVVIQTDGHENSSTQYTFQDLSLLVKELTAAGWVFVFLGAGIDAFGAGLKMGVAVSNVAGYSRDNSKAMFSMLSEKTSALRASGDAAAMQYTAADRHELDPMDVLPKTPEPVVAADKVARHAVDDINLKR